MGDEFEGISGERVNLHAIERGHFNAETGEFGSILASQGEASDGHILLIKGGQIPKRMPLLFGHHGPIEAPTIGSVLKPRKETLGDMPVIRVNPILDLGGPEGGPKDIRLNLWHMMTQRHLEAMSIRWETIEATRRTSLPASSPFHINPDDESMIEHPGRWGFLISKWRGKEGSIVPLGADTLALMGRAEASTTAEGRDFFTELAHTAQFRNFNDALVRMRDMGISMDEIVTMIDPDEKSDLRSVEYDDDGESKRFYVPATAAHLLRTKQELEDLDALARDDDEESLERDDDEDGLERDPEENADDEERELETVVEETVVIEVRRRKAINPAEVIRADIAAATAFHNQFMYDTYGRFPDGDH